MIPPDCDHWAEINRMMNVNGYTSYVEVEPKAGCRTFKFR